GGLLQCQYGRTASSQNDVRRESNQFRCVSTSPIGITGAPAGVDPHVAAINPAQFLQPLQECREASLALRIVCRQAHEHADAPHALPLLRARRGRPSCSRAAEERDELAPLHSITSSASASRLSGMVSPSALAVLMLMTKLNLVGCSTGKSLGFSPLRMRPT